MKITTFVMGYWLSPRGQCVQPRKIPVKSQSLFKKRKNYVFFQYLTFVCIKEILTDVTCYLVSWLSSLSLYQSN